MRELLPCAIENLRYVRQGRAIIDDLCLTIPPRSVTVIMGPNGAGKSVLIRLLHGLLPADAGHIHWAERPLDDVARAMQAMVFQRPVLLRRSVRANLTFVLNGARRKDAGYVDALLAAAGLAGKSHQPARLLSGGEQQRLALARALALEPKVLFLDEPTASLDPSATVAIEQTVLAAHAAGTKIVLVTHDIGQAHRLADDVVFLHRGRAVEHTAAERFFHQPSSTHGRAYLAGELVL